MKYTLALAIVLAAVATDCDSSLLKASPTSNLVAGYIATGDRRLYSSYVNRYAVHNIVQSEDVVWRGNITNRVTAVRATEVGVPQLASAWIISGGVGWSNVTVRFQSQRSKGYYYLLEVWGR